MGLTQGSKIYGVQAKRGAGIFVKLKDLREIIDANA